MTTTRRINGRESIYDKASRLLSDPDRVTTSPFARPPEYWTGHVRGDHGTYHVAAVSPEFMQRHGVAGGRLACPCRRGRTGGLCSHMLVGEEMRLRGES